MTHSSQPGTDHASCLISCRSTRSLYANERDDKLTSNTDDYILIHHTHPTNGAPDASPQSEKTIHRLTHPYDSVFPSPCTNILRALHDYYRQTVLTMLDPIQSESQAAERNQNARILYQCKLKWPLHKPSSVTLFSYFKIPFIFGRWKNLPISAKMRNYDRHKILDSFERPLSKLSENHKMNLIGPTELELWPFKVTLFNAGNWLWECRFSFRRVPLVS